MFERIGIIAKKGDTQIRDTLTSLVAFLGERRREVVVDDNCAQLLNGGSLGRWQPGLEQGCDLVIAIGGDGTMLSAAQTVSEQAVRLLGINLGRLGFLADVSPDEINTVLARILDGEYEEEQRFLLHCELVRDGQVMTSARALNDVVVQKRNIARLIAFETYIDRRFVHSQRSDGMIVSTPTGSTAYALSGGGPILHPSLDAMVLVPICPHTLSNRPIVVQGNSQIEVVMGTRAIDRARLTCDGEIKHALAPGDSVRIRKAERPLLLVHPAGHDHYAVLRAKLHWGRDLC